jgi:hypothetical protein
MKLRPLFFFFCSLLFSGIKSQTCPNAGFENGNFSNWNGATWTLSGANWTAAPSWTSGIVANGFNAYLSDPNARHTILTTPPGNNDPTLGTITGYDSLSLNPSTGKADIPFLSPSGSGVSVRLGNAERGAQTERLVYPVAINSSNALFKLQYAIVLEGAPGGPTNQHTSVDEPFFSIAVLDSNGNILNNCNSEKFGWNSVGLINNTGVPITIGGWTSAVTIYYKNWTELSLDLSAYVGQTIQLEFRTADCAQSGHFGYAYIDLMCSSPKFAVNYCGSNTAVLAAPAGYTSYQWYGPNGMTVIAGATNDSLTITNPVIGNVYYLVFTTQSGCTVTTSNTIQSTVVNILNFSAASSCQTGNSGIATVIPAGSSSGNYSYQWQTIPGGVTVSTAQTATGLSPGQYSITVSSTGCGNADTTVAITSLPTLNYTHTQIFCGTTISVAAPNGNNYAWYDQSGAIIQGETFSTLTVTNPLNNSVYTVVFSETSGCRDSVKIILKQTVVSSTQNANFCGSTANLCAPTGATNVNWYDANWPYSNIGNTNCISIANPVVSNWSPYYLSYTDSSTGCLDSVNIFLINTSISVYASNISPSCQGTNSGSATINIISNDSSFVLNVTGPQNYSNNSAGSVVMLNNLQAGTYNISAAVGSCSSTGSFSIDSVNADFSIALSDDTVCLGQQAYVSIGLNGNSVPGSCGAASSGCTSTTTSTVGTSTAQNSSTTYPTVYGNWYANEKYQLLYTAADLQAAGLSAGKISSISFEVVGIPAGMNTTFKNYHIKMGCTSATDLNPTSASIVPWQPVSQVVWGPQDYVVTTGWNTHTLTTPWLWDGTSNLVIEICYDWLGSSNYSYNAIMNMSSTSYNSYLLLNDDISTTCPDPNGETSYMSRPVTKFGSCNAAASVSDFSYNWWPSGGLSSVTSASPVASPSITTTYTVTLTSNNAGCSFTDSVSIYVNQTQGPQITSSNDTLYASQGSSYQWLLNGNIINGAVSQNYLPMQDGNYSAIISTANCGTDTSNIYTYSLLGKPEIDPMNELKVYPNPASNKIEINFDRKTEGILQIVSLTGEVVFQQRVKKAEYKVSVNTSSLPPAMYFLRLEDKNGKVSAIKIVIEK